MLVDFSRPGGVFATPKVEKTWTANNNFLVSWWVFVPVGTDCPGTSGEGCNWKYFWVGDTSHGWPYWADYVDVALSNGFGSVIFQKADDTGNGALTSCGYHGTLMGNGKWVRQTYYMQGATSNGKWWHQEMDGSTVMVPCSSSTEVTSRTGATWNWLTVPGYARQDSGTAYFDDMYLATGSGARARVEICNNATYTSATNCAISTPISWSDTSVIATMRAGSFTSGTAFVFITDANGIVNTTGFPVTIGSGTIDTTPPAAPTGFSVN